MITSTANSQIKTIVKLQKSASKRRKEGVFIVEGIRMFKEVPKDKLVDVYVTEQFYEDNKILFDGVKYEFVSESVYKEISDTMTPQGVLAVVEQAKYSLEEMLKLDNGLYLVLENIQDPGNLGTILRMSEGAGVDGLILSKDTVDMYNSKVVRSTMGAIFRVPFVYVEDICETVELLKKQGITTYAAHLQGEDFYNKDYRKSTCFFIGNEGNGLTEELTALADEKIKIPMCGQVESLNAATAATVLAYEGMRQRRLL